MDWFKPCAAEFIATFALVFIGAGSIVANAAGGGFGNLGIALAHGIVLAVFVSATMGISGGHVNPAVTIGAMATKKIPTNLGIRYIVAQILGGSVGAYALKAVFAADKLSAVAFGAPVLGSGVTQTQAILMEAFLTFFLVFSIFGTAVDERAPRLGGLAIGLVLVFDILVGGGVTGAAMNPASAFGPALASGGLSSKLSEHIVIYWLGPIIGAVAAAVAYENLFLKK
ncbi:MAG: aquaporin [Candidatus Aenigmarchaeota archaeon]|nr:aquaporin [Candidatus Aenigmarchaeota archaeon]